MEKRKPYPSDVSDEEWSFAAPYLTLMSNDAPQRRYELREVQRTALDAASRCLMAYAADQLPALRTGLSADAKLDSCRLL
jgi:transposase